MKRPLLPRVFRRLRDQRGTSLLESAFMVPLLILLTFTIVDFGCLFYVWLALENGASQATRYGVTGGLADDPGSPGSKLSRVDSIKLAMRQATPTLTIDDSAFTFSHMAVGGSSWLGGTGGPTDIEKVTVKYTWTLFTPMLWPLFNGGQVNLTVDSIMKNESAFQ